MTQAHQWEEQAYEHLNVGVQLRKIAQRRMALVDRGMDILDRMSLSLDDPEEFDKYTFRLNRLADTGDILNIATVIEKAVKIERLVTCANLHDINVLAKAAHHNGYRLVPKKDIGKADNTIEAGISANTVKAMRVAIAGEIL